LAGPFSAVNHAGFVVRDLDEGIRFFVDVLGFEIVADRKGTLSPNGDMLTRLFGVPAEASGRYQFFQRPQRAAPRTIRFGHGRRPGSPGPRAGSVDP
jgi:catechol 2,3-dioxygenase-like lactoylglutathione lyase family enzyme